MNKDWCLALKKEYKRHDHCEYCKEYKRIMGRGWCRNCYQRWWMKGKPDYKYKSVSNVHKIPNGVYEWCKR